jgi:hypothetical protein
MKKYLLIAPVGLYLIYVLVSCLLNPDGTFNKWAMVIGLVMVLVLASIFTAERTLLHQLPERNGSEETVIQKRLPVDSMAFAESGVRKRIIGSTIMSGLRAIFLGKVKHLRLSCWIYRKNT